MALIISAAALLVGRIGIGEEKAHGDGLDAVGLELADSVRDVARH